MAELVDLCVVHPNGMLISSRRPMKVKLVAFLDFFSLLYATAIRNQMVDKMWWAPLGKVLDLSIRFS